MKIELLANDGSPLGVIPPDIYGKGTGGAELAMMSLMTALAQQGHEVVVYNNPVNPANYDGVEYLPLAAFDICHQRDVLIIYRSPNARVEWNRVPKSQRVIWWSTDQYTIGDFSELGSRVDHIVTISPFHKAYFENRYGLPSAKITVIDIGVRLWDYAINVEQNPYQLIFCSVPDRGLKNLSTVWDKIKADVPEATLVVTSDYTLWGSANPGNQKHRVNFLHKEGVNFLGKVPRAELVKLQMSSFIQSYPCTYDELFCISVAECQVAGVFPITSQKGALQTTNTLGTKIPGDPDSPEFMKTFTQLVIDGLTRDRAEIEAGRERRIKLARKRFSFDHIVPQWEAIFEGKKTS